MDVNKRIDNYEKLKQKFRSEPADVDVLVVGSGMGGLSAAALLAKQGKKVYLAEKNNELGGYFGHFIEEDAIFDYGVSYALSLNDSGAAMQLMKELGLQNKIEMVRLKKLDKMIFGDAVYEMPDSKEEFQEYLIQRFPKEAENLRMFFKWLEEYYNGLNRKRPGLFIIRNFLKDYESFVRSYFTDQQLINILSMRIQAEPSSLFIMGGFINECLMNGMYYIKGGYGEFTYKIAESIHELGGYIGLNREVTALEYVAEDRTYKAMLMDGTQITSKYVVADISPFQLLKLWKCKGTDFKEDVAKLEKSIEKRMIGHSSINVYLKVNGGDLKSLDCGRIYIVPKEFHEFDIFEYYRHLESGGYWDTPILKIHIPSNFDNSICMEGESIIRVETDMCIDYFYELQKQQDGVEKEKDRILAYVLNMLDEYIEPGISGKVTYSKVFTPVDFEALMLNERGSGTGWAHTVDNYFKNVFQTKTNLPGCCIVGQWGELGSGLRQLVLSGKKSVEEIEKMENENTSYNNRRNEL